MLLLDMMEDKCVSLEDIEARWRNMPRIKKMWLGMKCQVYRAFDFPYHTKRIKWFIQRGRRGYADCDWWDMDAYLIGIILPMLKRLKADNMGYPGYGQASTPEKWDALLDEMVEGFTIAQKIMDDNYPLEQFIELQAQDRKLFEKKAKIFIKWFFHLWD